MFLNKHISDLIRSHHGVRLATCDEYCPHAHFIVTRHSPKTRKTSMQKMLTSFLDAKVFGKSFLVNPANGQTWMKELGIYPLKTHLNPFTSNFYFPAVIVNKHKGIKRGMKQMVINSIPLTSITLKFKYHIPIDTLWTHLIDIRIYRKSNNKSGLYHIKTTLEDIHKTTSTAFERQCKCHFDFAMQQSTFKDGRTMISAHTTTFYLYILMTHLFVLSQLRSIILVQHNS